MTHHALGDMATVKPVAETRQAIDSLRDMNPA